jgi:hypothetical protein
MRRIARPPHVSSVNHVHYHGSARTYKKILCPARLMLRNVYPYLLRVEPPAIVVDVVAIQ